MVSAEQLNSIKVSFKWANKSFEWIGASLVIKDAIQNSRDGLLKNKLFSYGKLNGISRAELNLWLKKILEKQ